MGAITLTVGRKLAIAVGTPLLALIVVASVGWRQLDWAAQELSDMGTEDMRIATGAGEIDGNLMDEAIEYEKVLRAAFATHTGDPRAQKWQDASIAEFERLAKVSDQTFVQVREVVAKAGEDSDPAVVATYADLQRRLAAIDKLQDAFENEVREVFKLVAQARHDEAMQRLDAVEAAQEKAEKEIAVFVEAVRKITEDNVTQALANAARTKLLLAVFSAVAVLAAAAVGASVAVKMLRQTLAARATAQRIASGDLTGIIHVESADEMGQMLAAMRDMQASLATVVGNVRENADGVATASAQIAQGNQDLSQRTEEQASSLEEAAASMEELGTTVRQNADNARQADKLAQGASQVAVKGGEVVHEVVQTMQGINESSRRIAEIIGTIDGIAFQTNILALNAAVEAARAGEQGRGFAVVAGEVRSLAQRSAAAAREIKDLIGASVARVEQGTTLVDKAGTTMHEVVGAIQRVTSIVGEISSASSEQSEGVNQVGEAVSQMDKVTQQNAALVEQSAAAAESLKHQAQRLVQAVAVFKVAPGAGGTALPALPAG